MEPSSSSNSSSKSLQETSYKSSSKSQSLIDYLNSNKIKPENINKITLVMFKCSGDSEKEKSIFKTDIETIKGDMFVKINYTQFAAPKDYLITKQARGTIFKYDSETEKYEIVARSFDRFFNHGEESVRDPIDWDSVKIVEKVDGSLIMLWYCKSSKKWIISTRGRIYSQGVFCTETRKLLNDSDIDYEKLNKDYTYSFELCSRYNQVIIDYEIPILYHIGTRNHVTGEELSIDIGLPKPKHYSFETMDDVVKQNIDGIEGFVVVDKDYHRQKIKMKSYLEIATPKTEKISEVLKDYVSGKLSNCLGDDPTNKDLLNTIDMCEFILSRFYKDHKSQVEHLLNVERKLVMKTCKDEKYNRCLVNWIFKNHDKYYGKSAPLQYKITMKETNSIIIKMKNSRIKSYMKNLKDVPPEIKKLPLFLIE